MLYSTRRSPYLCSPPGQTHLLLFNARRGPSFYLNSDKSIESPSAW
jgi:hypothetical protein